MAADEQVSDTDLMRALQAGDTSAFAVLVERHRPRVLRLAFRYLRDETAAEDLAQEAFLRVHRARDRWEPRAKFTTWLHRVTVNACLNEIRARKARRHVESTAPSGADGEGVLPEGEDTRHDRPPAALLRSELAARVRAAIATLPEDQRLATILSKYQGLSYRDLAEAMDRSVPAVKSLLVRARENLRRELEPYLDAAGPPGEDAVPISPDERRKRDRRAGREAP